MDKFISIRDFKEQSKRILTHNAQGFYSSGATDEQTLEENCRAFKDWRFQPRVLRDVSKIDTTASILGKKIQIPICIAPTSLQKLASKNGEIDSAKAAQISGTIFVLSTVATTSIEKIAFEAPLVLRWFQLYIAKDRNLTRRMVKRAENNGFSALVVTVDAPVLGIRYKDIKNKFSFSNLTLENFDDDKKYQIKNSGMAEFASSYTDSALCWQDIDWLKSITNLPIIVKGILTAEAATEALKHKIAGIWVSNHGGRQLDGVSATINILPEIAKTMNGKCEIYFDGGIRNGGDVAKAIALGATAVFVGRPILWGLTCGGQAGVGKVLEILKSEFEITMKLLGVRSIKELQSHPNLVIHNSKVIAKL